MITERLISTRTVMTFLAAAYNRNPHVAEIMQAPLARVMRSLRVPLFFQRVANMAGIAQSASAAHGQKEWRRTVSDEAIRCILSLAIRENRVLVWVYDNYDVDKLVLLAIHILAGLICERRQG